MSLRTWCSRWWSGGLRPSWSIGLDAGEDLTRPPVVRIPLASAAVCLDCEWVFSLDQGDACPSCTNRSVWTLARFLAERSPVTRCSFCGRPVAQGQGRRSRAGIECGRCQWTVRERRAMRANKGVNEESI